LSFHHPDIIDSILSFLQVDNLKLGQVLAAIICLTTFSAGETI